VRKSLERHRAVDHQLAQAGRRGDHGLDEALREHDDGFGEADVEPLEPRPVLACDHRERFHRQGHVDRQAAHERTRGRCEQRLELRGCERGAIVRDVEVRHEAVAKRRLVDGPLLDRHPTEPLVQPLAPSAYELRRDAALGDLDVERDQLAPRIAGGLQRVGVDQQRLAIPARAESELEVMRARHGFAAAWHSRA
jgi:hypothetical protein